MITPIPNLGAGNVVAPPPTATGNAPAAAGDDATKQAIAAYYAHLDVQTPVYDDDFDQSVVDTTHEQEIQRQLQALADRIKTILERNRCAQTTENAAQLDKFMDEIRRRGEEGKLSCEEVHYFYSKAFKGKLEGDILAADIATGGDIGPAMKKLEGLCQVLSVPSVMFSYVVKGSIIRSFVNDFRQALVIPPETAPSVRDAVNRSTASLPASLQRLHKELNEQRPSSPSNNARPV